MNPSFGRGFRGGGRGRGWRHWFHATGLTRWQRAGLGGSAWTTPGPYAYGGPVAPPISQEQEIETLKGQMEYFENALDAIRKRIEELQTKTEHA